MTEQEIIEMNEAFTAQVPALVMGANDFRLSRNHDGDLLLVINGKVHSIAAKFGSPLFCAILDFRADALQKVGAGGTAPEGHNANVSGVPPQD